MTGVGCNTSGLQGMVNSVSGGSTERFGNTVNEFLHSVNAHFTPLQDGDYTPGPHHIPDQYIISVEQLEQQLVGLDPRKGASPDGIPTWLLRDFTPLLAAPVCAILNSSIRVGCASDVATVVPIPKTNLPRMVEKDLRPMSLTPVLAKELEFFVCDWMLQLAGDQLDPSQFGAIKNLSAVHALVDLVHDWSVATDSSDKMVRALLLDYHKAFHLIDHHILLRKLGQLGLLEIVLRVGAFLHGWQQRVRVEQSASDWLLVNGGVPQGTRVGPIVFLFMVNDLLEGRHRVKFVDDTASWE